MIDAEAFVQHLFARYQVACERFDGMVATGKNPVRIEVAQDEMRALEKTIMEMIVRFAPKTSAVIDEMAKLPVAEPNEITGPPVAA